jgi:oligoribonuclease NrnB/cAMP/cGMP phosphodiesterase (DHH superfamily)
MSARIAQWTYMYGQADVLFTPYIYFGVKGLDGVDGYNHLLCLDIGSTEDTLQYLAERSSVSNVLLFDHHPTDPKSLEKYQSKGLRISWNSDHCTSSLIYDTFKNLQMFKDTYWPERWAIIGIYGDVAKDKPNSRKILDELSKKHTDLVSQLSAGSSNKNWMYQPASMISRAINMVRRIGYHNGAAITLKALEEVEKADDIFLLVRDLSMEDWGKYPYVTLMRSYIKEYREAASSVGLRLIDLDEFGVGIIKCKADVGGAIVRKAMRNLHKPVFIFNDGIVDGIYRITARSDSIDINKVIMKASEISNGLVSGGGHPQAAAGTAPTNVGVSRVVRYLKEAMQEVIRDERSSHQGG